MPIRINLLAEQLAAEEARRKDPVKRAIWAGSILAGLALLWSVALFFQVQGAKSEMANYEAEFNRLDEEAREIKANKAAFDEAYLRVRSLERYATNRFLWGNVLNDIQLAVKKVDGIKLDEIAGDHRYITNAEVKTKTAFKLKYIPPPPAWKFWQSESVAPNYGMMITNEFKALTNKPPYSTNRVAVSMKLLNMVTNLPDTLTANVEIITPVTAIEETSVILRARDYGTQSRKIDAFSKALAEGAYLKERLRKREGMGVLVREISKPREDMIEAPGEIYTPFTLELEFEPRVFIE